MGTPDLSELLQLVSSICLQSAAVNHANRPEAAHRGARRRLPPSAAEAICRSPQPRTIATSVAFRPRNSDPQIAAAVVDRAKAPVIY